MTTDVFRRLERALDGVAPVGVVHVGAHRGQEVPDYRRAGFAHVVLIEPNSRLADALAAAGADAVHQCAAGRPGRAQLHVTTWDERSSLLEPVSYPVSEVVEVDVRPLAEMQDRCNVAVLDCQGAELDVLDTADMAELDAVIVECTDDARYVGAATTSEVVAYMEALGWDRVGSWGGHSAGIKDIVWRRS